MGGSFGLSPTPPGIPALRPVQGLVLDFLSPAVSSFARSLLSPPSPGEKNLPLTPHPSWIFECWMLPTGTLSCFLLGQMLLAFPASLTLGLLPAPLFQIQLSANMYPGAAEHGSSSQVFPCHPRERPGYSFLSAMAQSTPPTVGACGVNQWLDGVSLFLCLPLSAFQIKCQ